MLLLNVKDEARFRCEERQGAVAFVGLHHEGFAIRPRGVGAEERHLRTDVVRGILIGLTQDVREHGGSGRLPVAARDDVGALRVGQNDEAFGAADTDDPVLHRRLTLGIFRGDGRRKDHDRDAGDMRGGMAFKIFDARRNIGGGILGGNQIRAGNVVPLRQEETGQAAHAAATHADDVDFLRTALEQVGELLL